MAGPSAEILRKIQNLELKEMNKSNLLSVVAKPTSPVTSEPRILFNHVVMVAMAGLMIGVGMVTLKSFFCLPQVFMVVNGSPECPRLVST